MVESVYDASECVLTTSSEQACAVGDDLALLLGETDADGEVRSLILTAKDGQALHIGRLGKASSYTRIKLEDGSTQGFMSNAKEGSVEVYATEAKLNALERDERLPVMLKYVFDMATSTLSEKQKPRIP